MLSWVWGCADDPKSESTANMGVTTVETTMETADSGNVPTEGGSETGCEGLELAQDGVLDLDVPAVPYVVVKGAVRLNGGALPDADAPRGQIQFDYVTPGGPPGVVAYALEATGAEEYTVVLPAGAATVRYVPDPGLCAASPEGPMPCTGGVIVDGVVLNDSGILDVDIPAVVVGGKVTQNGAAMPDAAGDRGHLEFSRALGEGVEAVEVVATASFEETGLASYQVALFPGTYDVAFAGNAGLCSDGAAPVPCNRGVVLPGLKLMTTGVLDVDVKRVEVKGVVKVNGAAMAAGTDDRGALRFDAAGGLAGGGIVTQPFGASGLVEYGLSLVAGAYSVALVANPGQCTGEPAPTPCVGGPVLSSLMLEASGTLDVDIPRIEVSGKVTLKGAALPDQSGDRGAVVFGRESGDATSVPLETSGPINYVLSVMPGEYTISYTGNAGLCDGVKAPAMPCSGGPLTTLKLADTGVLDLDVPAVKVSGKLTRNGAALPNQPTDRGSVVFAAESGAAVAVPLGTDALADYALTLLPAKYDVVYTAAGGECMVAPDNLMPCGGGRLLSGVALAMDGVLDLDVKAISITGNVTHAGAALPDLMMSRGGLRWRRADGTGTGLSIDLETEGAKLYEAVIVPGRWIVDHAANPLLCEDGVPEFPCTDQSLLGCN